MRSALALSFVFAFAFGGNAVLANSSAPNGQVSPVFVVDHERYTPAGYDGDGRLTLQRLVGRNDAASQTITVGRSVVVEIAPGGDIDAIGKALGATSRKQVGGLSRFIRFDLASPEAALRFVNGENAVAGVRSIEPEVYQRYVTRDTPNDPRFASQQHLRNTGQSSGTIGSDANVTSWWNFAGGTRLGAGVNIAVVDDGLRHTHEDIQPNYRPTLSYDFNGSDSDPMNAAGKNHGTSVAGVAAARANNGIGGSGAAPLAGISGIRLIDGGVTGSTQAAAISFQSNNQNNLGTNHIYSNSWGPSDNGTTLGTIGTATRAALQENATNGRGGRGNIYVWAGGNGGNADNANYDAFANNRNVIAVAALTNQNVRASYSERGSNIFVTAPSNGGTRGIDTTDGDANNDYTTGFGGTSSATPLVAGVVALMLEANPNLGARDVKHILARTSTVVDDTASGRWQTNAAGRRHSEKYGFGRINAFAAATMASTWTNVGPQISASKSSGSLALAIPDGTGTPNTSNETLSTFGAAASNIINFTDELRIETVEVTINVSHLNRGDLQFELTGPSGTKSVLGTVREDTGDNFNNWIFSSVRYWDELSIGAWSLSIRDGRSSVTGTFDNWTLAVYGTVVPEPSVLAIIAITATFTLRRRARDR